MRSPAQNGVWLQAGTPPPNTQTVRTPSGQIVLEENASGGGLKLLWYHSVSIEIGIGPDPNVAKGIFDSIGFTSHEPDSPATGVCARSSHPAAMPTPVRLEKPLVLNRGDITLDPPSPSDQPTMSAAQAWSESDPKQNYERYRLLLTEYSAKLPARLNPDGSLTPLNQNEPAWVVYSSPRSATTSGCGLWGVVAFDAHNGQQIISGGWSPGP
jgi:hypothetical protein